MAKTIEATGEVASLFNGLAIALAIEILSGRLDDEKNSPGYQRLLDEFERHHPNFKPKSWQNLKEWLAYYNASKDIELLLAPSLFGLSQQYQDQPDNEILDELTNLVWKNRTQIETGDVGGLIVLNEQHQVLFPKIDKLDYRDRVNLLSVLRNIFKKFTDAFNPVQIRAFLEKNAQDVLSDLKNIISADRTAYQRSFASNEIQGMTNALNIEVVENDSDMTLDPRTKIYLQRNGHNWSACCTDADAEAFIDQSTPKLTMTIHEAFQGKITVIAPAVRRQQENSPSFLISQKIINNPGEGACAFYAFAIGLIDIIQYEKACGRRDMFDRWVAVDDSISMQYDAICAYDFDNPDNDLLHQLQNSLRLVSYHAQRIDLQKAAADPDQNYRKLVGTSTYNKFAELYHNPAANPRFNVLATSGAVIEAIKRIDRRRVVTNSEHLTLVPIFLSLIYGNHIDIGTITPDTNPRDDSPIIQSLGNITQELFWGTHLDLDFLAIAFGVNFHPLLNGRPIQRFNDSEGQHTITVDNEHNAHWTTQVNRAEVRNPDFTRAAILDSSGKKVPFQLTPSQLGRERGYDLESQGLDQGLTTERAGMQNDQEKIEFLQGAITRATINYVNYSNSIWFSLFHRHGNTGRVRAQSFLSTFLEIEDYDEAKKCLIEFLSNDHNNGNTHPHSYRTMLLQEMLVVHGNEYDKPTLQDTSKHFDGRLAEFANALDVRLVSLSRPK